MKGIFYTEGTMGKIRTKDIRPGDLLILKNGKISLAIINSSKQPIEHTSQNTEPILAIVHKGDKIYESLFKKWLIGKKVKIEKALIVYL